MIVQVMSPSAVRNYLKYAQTSVSYAVRRVGLSTPVEDRTRRRAHEEAGKAGLSYLYTVYKRLYLVVFLTNKQRPLS